MTGEHLPILQVVVPLLAAPVCLLLMRGTLAWLVATGVTWYALYVALALLDGVSPDAPVRYALGGWMAPWGIEYVVDRLGAYVLVIVAAIGALVTTFARASVAREIPAGQHAAFYAALLLCFAGLLGIVITGDAFNLFVFLEISSLSSYALISLGRDRRALTASYQYLIMGTLGATFILIGVGLLYMLTGTLNMLDLASRLPEIGPENRTLIAAAAFLVVGICLKIALFPLHLWLPNAYAYAPSVVTAFLAGTATKVAVYVLLRFLYTVFGYDAPLNTWVGTLLIALALAGVLVASTVAIFQDDTKRMFAYSSVAQIGYIVLGIGFASATGLTAALVHLFNHAVMKAVLFLALGAVVYRVGGARLSDLRGLGHAMPLTMAALVVGGLSLIGVPLTAGFISKWYLVLAALEAGWWPVAVLVLFGSLLAVIYVWRVVETTYMQPRPEGAVTVSEAPWHLLLPIWVLVAANIWFGIDTDLTVGVAGGIASDLLGSAR
ncbi:MAG: monovalent cation/H+ antiporter subunit D family protein [Gammaproteobacteria bacterium]|nr:monovalent cation/H+ antiporter subunit D family protein [Gammaproteobacteria bacterium]